MSRRKKLTNNSGIPQHEIENIARILLPNILAFYESEEGQREFAEWQAAQDGAKMDKDSNGENVCNHAQLMSKRAYTSKHPGKARII